MRQTIAVIVVPTEDWAAVQRGLPKGSLVSAETLEEGLPDDARGRLAKEAHSGIARAMAAPKRAETPAEEAQRLTRQAADREAADAAERAKREGDEANQQ